MFEHSVKKTNFQHSTSHKLGCNQKIKNSCSGIVDHGVLLDKVDKFEVSSYDTEKEDRFCALIPFKVDILKW